MPRAGTRPPSRRAAAASPGGPRFTMTMRFADPGWKARVPGLAVQVRRAVRLALAAELPGRTRTDLSLLFTGNAEMQRLNQLWRGKRKPTNVLSFPAEAALDPGAPPAYLGDIALGFEICAAESRVAGKPFADHVTHLVVHGVLHLLGYDHETEAQAGAMEPRETELLAQLKIPDPYRIRRTGRGKPNSTARVRQTAK